MTFSEAFTELVNKGTDPQIISALREFESKHNALDTEKKGLETEYAQYKADSTKELNNIQVSFRNVMQDLRAYEQGAYETVSKNQRKPTVEEFKLIQQGKLTQEELAKRIKGDLVNA